MSEIKLILYTNDAILLTLARFPFYIIHWELSSQSQQGITIIEQEDEITLSSHIIHKLKTNEPTKRLFLPIEEKLFNLPVGFTPKINKLLCIDNEKRPLTWQRETLHPKFIAEPGHVEIIDYINKIWDLGYNYLERLIKDRPNIKEYFPRYKRPSILQLETVNGETNIQDIDLLWDIFGQIVYGGNEYARTPICMVVERKKIKKNIWEYSILEDIKPKLQDLIESQQIEREKEVIS